MIRYLLFAFLIALGIAIFGAIVWALLDQRQYIAIAKFLKFKIDDTKKVEKEVEEILKDETDQEESSKKKKSK